MLSFQRTIVAVCTGLEPVNSAVTGRHDNQLHQHTKSDGCFGYNHQNLERSPTNGRTFTTETALSNDFSTPSPLTPFGWKTSCGKSGIRTPGTLQFA